MKNFLLIITSLFIVNTYSQELKGIPATDVVKHQRLSGFNEIIKEVSNKVSSPN